MTPENFVYWLQGFLEISETKTLSEKQVQMIRNHICLVLRKVTENFEELPTPLEATWPQNDPRDLKPIILREPSLIKIC